MIKIENYIAGNLVAPESNEYLDNFNPATGEVYSLIPDSDERDVTNAVEAARKAFPVWSKMSAEARHDHFNARFRFDRTRSGRIGGSRKH